MTESRVVRDPNHAGSWYTANPTQLNIQLEGWLAAVKPPVSCIGPETEGQPVPELPIPNARVIIGPHAGYSYSGPSAAWAYKSWDISKAKRIFLLGPSHHYYLSKAAVSKCTHYGTPLGDLVVDRETTQVLSKTGSFEWMSQSVDEEEHSLEMHIPYIYKCLTNTFGSDPSKHPPLVPIMIGNTSASTEKSLGRILAPYLADETNAFVISSDFAHWGQRFRYTYYQQSPSTPGINLSSGSRTPKDPPIHESIKAVDFECMGACEKGSHDGWLRCLEGNGNTVCGRHPIGVIMAAIEEVRNTSGKEDIGKFHFVRYERSSEVKKITDSSVSYASAYAVM